MRATHSFRYNYSTFNPLEHFIIRSRNVPNLDPQLIQIGAYAENKLATSDSIVMSSTIFERHFAAKPTANPFGIRLQEGNAACY